MLRPVLRSVLNKIKYYTKDESFHYQSYGPFSVVDKILFGKTTKDEKYYTCNYESEVVYYLDKKVLFVL